MMGESIGAFPGSGSAMVKQLVGVGVSAHYADDRASRASTLGRRDPGQRYRFAALHFDDPEVEKKLVGDTVVSHASPHDGTVHASIPSLDLHQCIAYCIHLERTRRLKGLEEDLGGIVPARRLGVDDAIP